MIAFPSPLPVDLVQLSVFEAATGYSPDAVQKKIKNGTWREGIHFVRASDGHILMSLRAYHQWAVNPSRAA